MADLRPIYATARIERRGEITVEEVAAEFEAELRRYFIEAQENPPEPADAWVEHYEDLFAHPVFGRVVGSEIELWWTPTMIRLPDHEPLKRLR